MPVLLTLTLRQDSVLRTGCEADDSAIASVKAGRPLQIRFGRTDSAGVCYKVAVDVEGKAVEGYVPAAAISGLEEYERQRQAAGSSNLPQMDRAEVEAFAHGSSAPEIADAAQKAAGLLRDNQPAQALNLLEPLLDRHRRDPYLLAMAGVAAYRSDLVERATGYWQDSLAIQPNPTVEAWLRKARKESVAESGGQKLYGSRFLLRYEGAAIPADSAHQVMAVLEDQFSRVSSELGCSAPERIVTIVESIDAYRKATDAAEWSGGRFDGKIRIALLEGLMVGPATRRALAHEVVHACLAIIGPFPAWLHEGLAQKYTGDTLAAESRRKAEAALRAGSLPRLDRMSQTWSRMSAEHAAQAYAVAYMAAELLLDNYRQYGIANILKNPNLLAQVTSELDRALRR